MMVAGSASFLKEMVPMVVAESIQGSKISTVRVEVTSKRAVAVAGSSATSNIFKLTGAVFV